MAKTNQSSLPRRQRQILEILYRRGRASVSEVMEELTGDPVYSTVRNQLRLLEERGHVKHEEQGMRYVYLPAVPHSTARESALRHLIDTFFEGSTGLVMASLIGNERTKMTEDEIGQVEKLLEKARKGKRK